MSARQQPRGRPSRVRSRNYMRRPSRSPTRPKAKGNQNGTNRGRASSNPKRNTKSNPRKQERQNRVNRRRVYGYFFCEECNEIFASDRVYETISRYNEPWYSTEECPSCRYRILPYEVIPFALGMNGNGNKSSNGRSSPNRKQNTKRNRRRETVDFEPNSKGRRQTNSTKAVCASCRSRKCRCRCTRCECAHHKRGCGALFKDCRCETRQFGSYQCASCHNEWSSGYTFVRGRGQRGKALYGQQCKSCNDRRYHKAYKWRELEVVACPVCRKKPCNKDPPCQQKPHQQALCKRCKNKAVPCSSRWG